jgi:hypothetical protein
MDIEAIFHVATAVLLSVGGGGIFVLGLSGWLGKVWAERLMARETQTHRLELEKLRIELQTDADRHGENYRHKIELYKEVANPLIELIVKAQHNGTLSKDDLQNFDAARLTTTALLGMFSPEAVFIEYNTLIDYVYDSFDGKATWSFPEFRIRALKFLSLVRADIGIYTDELRYMGTR